jgi:hypothetical protein
MTPEDSLQFAQDRLRHHHDGPLARGLGRERRPRVTRRFALELPRGEARVFERVDETVKVICTSGSVWITHDGDCKDVILAGRESYQAEREDAMHLFALQDCVLELEFEDELIPHA